MKNASRYGYVVSLQNGDEVCSSGETTFGTEEEARDAAWDMVGDLVESQDCCDEDRFTEGDYRVKAHAL